ncbi:MAG: MFS transporter [Burkholderiaceae bacterium]|nr:MFS transporter [Burkholderiaceae bacterium]
MTQQAIGRYRWIICALLFFSTTANYLDRTVLSLLEPRLATEFGWSNSDYANITSIFLVVYAISMLFAGRIIDGIGTKKGYIFAITIWSIGAIMHAFAIPLGEGVNALFGVLGLTAVSVSIAGFMISYAVLAFGESGNFPAALKTTAEYFPKKERSLVAGIFNSGANIGAILGPLTVPWIASTWGWQAAFVIVGAIGLSWIVFWLMFYEKPSQQKRLSKAELDYINSDEADAPSTSSDNDKQISWFQLLRYRQTWAFAFGKFMTDGVWWFFLLWLPKYLAVQFDLHGTQIAAPLAVLYSMTMIGSIGGGWLPAYFINRGASVFDGRRKAMLLIAFFPLAVLLAQPLGGISMWIPVLLIGIGASAHQAWSANIFTTPSDSFPKKLVASVIGIGGMAGGLGGVLFQKGSGWLFDYYQAAGHVQTGYMIVFSFCASAYLIAWVVMKALVPVPSEVRM